MLPLLLIITSDRALTDSMRHEIGVAGFKAYYVETLASARAVMAQWRFDAVVLYAEGFEGRIQGMLAGLCRDEGVPILLGEPGADEEEQLRVLEAGASQVVVEPTSARVLAAQLRRLIDVAHPRQPHEPKEVRFGSLRLDPSRAAASVRFEVMIRSSGSIDSRRPLGRLRLGMQGARRRIGATLRHEKYRCVCMFAIDHAPRPWSGSQIRVLSTCWRSPCPSPFPSSSSSMSPVRAGDAASRRSSRKACRRTSTTTASC